MRRSPGASARAGPSCCANRTPTASASRRASRSPPTALGIDIAGVADWTSVERIVRRVRAARPDTVFLAGVLDPASTRVLRALRRVLPARTRFVASDGFAFDDAIKALGSASDGMYVSVAGLPTERLPRRGRRFVRRLARAVGGRPDLYSIYAAQATEVLLDAIARSDGTRASVRREIFRTRVRDGLIGNFTITPSGNCHDPALRLGVPDHRR